MYIEAINHCPMSSKPIYPIYQLMPQQARLAHLVVSFFFSIGPDRLDVAYNVIQ